MDASRRIFSVAFLVFPLAACMRLRARDDVVELHVASDGDELAFKPNRLTCPTRSMVRIFFHHTGEILSDPHDLVVLKPGTLARFIADADRESETRLIPDGDASLVVAAVPLCGRGETAMVQFIAPEPGEYPFVCSVPGHGETMRGILTVTN
jgi:azurin